MALGGTVDILATEDPDAIAEEHEELQIYEKHNNLLHGSKRKKYAARLPQHELEYPVWKHRLCV